MFDTFPKTSADKCGLLTDRQIKDLCVKQPIAIESDPKSRPMISPFHDKMKSENTVSFGLSSCGYDVTLAPEFKIFSNIYTADDGSVVVIDPKNFDENSYVDREGDVCIIPPNGFVLGRTNEYFVIPDDIMVICVGKSTYARCGIHVLVTPIEPGFEGQVVIEIVNHTPHPAKIYANEGICQFLFFRTIERCETSYRDRGGKYMGQTGIRLPSVVT